MQLRYFNPIEDESGAPSKQPRISVSAKQNTITLNPAALESLKLKGGDFINFAEDEQRPGDWYMGLHIPNTLKLFDLVASTRPESPSTKVKNKRLVAELLSSIGMKGQSVCIPLGELTMDGTQPIVALLTRMAYPAKKVTRKQKLSCTPASESTNLEQVA